MSYQYFFPVAGVIGLLFALWTFFDIKKKNEGSQIMKEIAEQIHLGAMVFLKREYTIVIVFAVVVFAALTKFLSLGTGLAFIAGASCSMLAGFFGMKAATRSSGRTTQSAIEKGTPAALDIAFRGGSVMGISVAALGLIGISLTYFFTKELLS